MSFKKVVLIFNLISFILSLNLRAEAKQSNNQKDYIFKRKNFSFMVLQYK